MSKIFYPAIFTQEADGYSVAFPDLDGCFTEGDSLQEAYEMATEAIGLYLQDQVTNAFCNLPISSQPNSIHCGENEFMVLIEFDEMEYCKKHQNKAVKKTLTIPSWLNSMAEKNNVNFSGVLQNALIEQLHIQK